MSKKKPVANTWDLRKPTLVRWWEDTETLQDESNSPNTLRESPSARQAVIRWLSEYKQYGNKEKENDAVTTDDNIASDDRGSTTVRVDDIDKEYAVDKKDSVDKSDKVVRESIIEKKDDNIVDKDNDDRKDIKRNDKNINEKNRNDRNRNDRNRNDRNRNDKNYSNKYDNQCNKCNKRRKQMKVEVSTKIN